MEIFIIIWFALVGNAADQVYGPGVVGPVECVGVACDNDRGNGFADRQTGVEFDVPDAPDVPDRDDKPGWGHGDKNHDHKGPPGREK